MKKEMRLLKKAKASSLNSTCHHKHGALLVKGSRILKVSFNKNSFSSTANRYRRMRRKNPWFGTRHAEIELLSHRQTQGSTVYVCRVNNHDDLMYSKPCGMCMAAMKHAGVKTVVYSVGKNELEKINLRRDND